MNADALFGLLAPELALLFGGCVVLAVGLFNTSRDRQWVSPIALIVLVVALVLTLRAGSQQIGVEAFGLWISSLTFYARWVALSIGILIVLVNWHQPEVNERGEYMALILFSLLGVLLTASANDLVVLFFAIELVSVPTYALIALSRRDRRASEAAVKYFFLGAMAAAMLAYGLVLLYGAAGTTTLYKLQGAAATSMWAVGTAMGPLALTGLLLVIGGLAFKIAAVPFHAYAPDVYEGAAAPITGMLGFIPKLAGFIALIKILGACNWDLPLSVNWLLWGLAVCTMTAGNVMALLQDNAKRMLAYSSIAHTGYMLVALLVGPLSGEGPLRDGVAALLFYMAVYGAMNLGAFALLTAFRVEGEEIESLRDLGGLATRRPATGIALAVCVFSLMGLPPTAGFLGKLYVFSSALSLPDSHAFHGPMLALVIIGVLNSAIGAAYYLRLIGSVYMGSEERKITPNGGLPVRLGLALCSCAMIVVFVWPTGLMRQARNATRPLELSISALKMKQAAKQRQAFQIADSTTAATDDAVSDTDDNG